MATKLRLIMAVSSDGFVAKGPKDDMRWTGRMDKRVFQLLTSVEPTLLLGRTTFEAMPNLPGREVICLSTSGLTLEEAAADYPGAWLGGGPTVALKALELGLVGQAFIHWVDAEIGEGIPFEPIRQLLPKTPRVISIGRELDVYVYQGVGS